MIVNIHDELDTGLTGDNKITMGTKMEDNYGVMHDNKSIQKV